jgi:intracellular multiplication protein IcmK
MANHTMKTTITILCTSLFAVSSAYAALPLGHASDIQTQTSGQKVASKAAFQKLLAQYFPLTPKQIHKFKTRAAQEQQANAQAAGPAPAKSTSSIILASLKPGSAEPIVRLGHGQVSSLVFTDAAGKPWPVTSYTVGNSKDFNVNWNKKSATLMIQGQALFGQSNIAVTLQGLDVPVMVTLMLGQKDWDYLDYIRVGAYQPSDQGIAARPVSAAPNYLIKLLEGISPQGAVALQVEGRGEQVWAYKGKYLLLTSGTLMSPAWSSRANGSGPNPLHAYVLQKAPYLMVSQNGATQRVLVSQGGQSNAE